MSDCNNSLKRDMALVILGGLVASFGTIGVNWISSASEEHNVAQALYFDISMTTDHLRYTYVVFNDSVDYKLSHKTNDDGVFAPIIYDHVPYYTNNGAYFVFMKDIPKLDIDLSNDINQYYQSVLDVEYKRQYISNKLSNPYKTENFSNEDYENLSVFAYSMNVEMGEAVTLGDKVKNELADKYQLNTSLPEYFIPTVYSQPDCIDRLN
jgi:hypothetical protein